MPAPPVIRAEALRLRGGRWPLRTALAALALLVLAACGEGRPLAAERPAVRPGRIVHLPDGRAINLRCLGRGSPVVLLESGFGADSEAWRRVQAGLSPLTQVCAYDRAGYGFSDPGPLPRDGVAIARDLDAALRAARLNGPYVLVGHSAGGLYARLFAARRPHEVAGLVLLDPTVERRAPISADGLEGLRKRISRCLATAQANPQPADDNDAWSGCITPHMSTQAAAIAHKPQTWLQQLSELNAIFDRTSDEVLHIGELLNGVPVYVLTASDSAAAAPMIGADHPQSLLELSHMRLAFSFAHGWQRTVLSSHLIMIDRPEVVVDAAGAMVRAARAGGLPEPLPASEAPETAGASFAAPVTK